MLLVGLGGCGAAAGPTRPRAVLDFRDGWRFSRTDMGADSLDAGCSEAGLPCAPGFNDAGWRALSIPHDFVVEAPLVPSEDSVAKNQGYRDYGKAWYRLTFSLPEAWAHRSVWIDFDGVAGYVRDRDGPCVRTGQSHALTYPADHTQPHIRTATPRRS